MKHLNLYWFLPLVVFFVLLFFPVELLAFALVGAVAISVPILQIKRDLEAENRWLLRRLDREGLTTKEEIAELHDYVS